MRIPDTGINEATLIQIADHPRLPTPPALALQVLDRASQPDCTVAEITKLVNCDAGLCGKILKTVNSALFSLPRAVSSLHRAIALLGIKSVRSLVLSVSLPALQRQPTDEHTRAYWQSSVAGAIVARELAVRLRRPDAEDDLVAGLLRDIGTVMLQQVLPDAYARLPESVAGEPAHAQCERERAALGVDHAEVGAFVLRHWRLPLEITEAIRCHHRPAEAAGLSRPAAERAELLYFATRLTQLLGAPHQADLAREIRSLAHAQFGMGERQLDEFLATLGSRIQEFAAVLSVDIGHCPNYAAVLARATEELVQLTVESNVATLRARQQQNQAEQEANRWRLTAAQLRNKAESDPLTGVSNRGFFEGFLDATFKAARRHGTSVGLLFLDLDNFKPLNDAFGHAFGDRVLREVAARLRAEAGARATVARYGGDEFCVLVPGLAETELRPLAQRLWTAITGLTIREGENCGKVGVSIGAAHCYPSYTRLTTWQLLNAADGAMYHAKRLGKNRVELLSLLSVEERKHLEEVRACRFSVYLADHGLVAEPHLAEATRLITAPRWRVGRLARKLGWLGTEALRAILRQQRRIGKPFGGCAVALRQLTQSQVHYLLAIQQECPEALADNLVDLGVLTEVEAQEAVKAYLRLARAGGDLPEPILCEACAANEYSGDRTKEAALGRG